MLEPLTPLTATGLENSENVGAISSLVSAMDDITLTNVTWEF